MTALKDIVNRIAGSGYGSFLSVLKLLGEANQNLLSFPVKGLTLALDFKFRPEILPFLDRMDHLIAEYGGRIYLAKDARMSKEMFRKMYPAWEDFQAIREKYHAVGIYESMQSRRLGL